MMFNFFRKANKENLSEIKMSDAMPPNPPDRSSPEGQIFKMVEFLFCYSGGVYPLIRLADKVPFDSRFFINNYGILDPEQFHKRLLKDGYFSVPTLEDKLKMLPFAVLKKLARNSNIRPGRGIDETSRRISENKNVLNKADIIFETKGIVGYVISEKGREFLENNKEYVTLHKHYWIDFEDYEQSRKKLEAKKGHCSFCDIALDVLENKKTNNEEDMEIIEYQIESLKNEYK